MNHFSLRISFEQARQRIIVLPILTTDLKVMTNGIIKITGDGETKLQEGRVPDQSVFASGGQTNGTVLNLAARHQDGKWVMVYLGSQASFSVNLEKIKSTDTARAFWIDPRSGTTVAIGTCPTTGVKSFTTPDGWEDALLILERAGG